MMVSTASTGFYLLHLRLAVSRPIVIGRLGSFFFPAGDYLYAGSAFGPGGLPARLERHLRTEKKLRWHIDYLRQSCEVSGILTCPVTPGGLDQGASRLECAWSQALLSLTGARLPVRGFGSSDCRSGCLAHLVHLPQVDWESLISQLHCRPRF